MIWFKEKLFLIKTKVINRRKSYKQKEYQYELLDNLDVFVSRGYSLSESLNLLKRRYKLEKVIEDLSEGKYLFESLEESKFDPDSLLMLEIAEKTGDLKTGIKNAAQIIEDKIKAKNQIFEVLKYPLLLFGLLILTLSFVNFFLMPQFKNIYVSFGIDAGLAIKMIFLIIKVVPIISLSTLIILGSLIIYVQIQPADKKYEYYFKNKYISTYFIRIYNQIFAMNLVNLLKLGLRIDQILMVLKDQEYNELLSLESQRILAELNDGYQLVDIVDNKFYTEELKMLIRDGETHSTLVHNLENYVIFLQQSQKSRGEKLIFWIQPIFYLIFGVLIVMLYASIFIPMFKMMEEL